MFDVIIYQHIALRWSAKPWLAGKAINIWLLWSQNPQFYLSFSGSTFPALASKRFDVFVKVFFAVVVA